MMLFSPQHTMLLLNTFPQNNKKQEYELYSMQRTRYHIINLKVLGLTRFPVSSYRENYVGYKSVEFPFQSIYMGAKGDWDFRIPDLVKNPDGTDI